MTTAPELDYQYELLELPPRKPRVLIIGPSGGGKTTAGEMLCKAMRTHGPADTSTILMLEFAEDEVEPLRGVLSPSVLDTVRTAIHRFLRDHKASLRKELFDFGNRKKADNPAYYARSAVGMCDVVTGVRTKAELAAARPLFDRVIWVQRAGFERGETDEIEATDADEQFIGLSLVEMQVAMEQLAQRLRGERGNNEQAN
jgi:hypothetical protein